MVCGASLRLAEWSDSNWITTKLSTSGRLDFHVQDRQSHGLLCPHLLSASWITKILFEGTVRTMNARVEKVDKHVMGGDPSR